MANLQPGILEPVPCAARYLFFSVKPSADTDGVIKSIAALNLGAGNVAGLGHSLVLATGKHIPGLTDFPNYVGSAVDIAATPYAFWCWLRSEDRGNLVHETHRIATALEGGLILDSVVDAFRYHSGLDLTGYEDGTENPKGEEATDAAFLKDANPNLDGSSFVAVQKWKHDLARFQAYPEREQDNIIGRRRRDNVELVDAPPSAHVKRTAQESFDPAAFVVRRSMPWSDALGEGLMFVAFGRDFTAFDAQLKRMIGMDDGIKDGLFKFTRPTSGSYFWCPPLLGDRLNLRALF